VNFLTMFFHRAVSLAQEAATRPTASHSSDAVDEMWKVVREALDSKLHFL
jgi:hypothetical protein